MSTNPPSSEAPHDPTHPSARVRWNLPLTPDGVIFELEDGSRFRVRPVRATDRTALQEAYEQLSPESRYRRFFTLMPHLPEEWATRLTDIDHTTHRAWVVFDPDAPSGHGDDGVAVARLINDADEPAVAEAAFAVADDYQGRGIGRLLFELIVSTAVLADLNVIRADTLRENRPMIGLLRSFGAVKNAERSDADIVCYELPVPTAEQADITAGALYELLRRT